MNYLAGLPAFLCYLIVGVAMLVLFMFCYSKATPHQEWKLIQAGNTAASAAYGGAILGFTIPLYSAMSHSVSLVDFILWGIVAFVVQIVTFFATKGVLKIQGESLSTHISEAHVAYGVLSGSIAVAVGLLNAAAMTW
ncbi:DUF350 domain-containing protein [Halomonas sp. THAF12]|uniref:DUF350 domain-containing protein n=1 Tax=Halomonas sp. B23F22_10 TaxID=3459515 RepID=UPI00373E6671